VQTVEEKELFEVTDLKGSEGVVTFKVTTDILRYGDYQIALIADTAENVRSEVARYNLRVTSS
jgi:hypothetical protein